VVSKRLRIIGDVYEPSRVVLELSGNVYWAAAGGSITTLTMRRPRQLPHARACVRVLRGGWLDLASVIVNNEGAHGAALACERGGALGLFCAAVTGSPAAGVATVGGLLMICASEVMKCRGDGVYVAGPRARAIVLDSKVVENGGAGVRALRETGLVVRHNDLAGNAKGPLCVDAEAGHGWAPASVMSWKNLVAQEEEDRGRGLIGKGTYEAERERLDLMWDDDGKGPVRSRPPTPERDEEEEEEAYYYYYQEEDEPEEDPYGAEAFEYDYVGFRRGSKRRRGGADSAADEGEGAGGESPENPDGDGLPPGMAPYVPPGMGEYVPVAGPPAPAAPPAAAAPPPYPPPPASQPAPPAPNLTGLPAYAPPGQQMQPSLQLQLQAPPPRLQQQAHSPMRGAYGPPGVPPLNPQLLGGAAGPAYGMGGGGGGGGGMGGGPSAYAMQHMQLQLQMQQSAMGPGFSSPPKKRAHMAGANGSPGFAAYPPQAPHMHPSLHSHNHNPMAGMGMGMGMGVPQVGLGLGMGGGGAPHPYLNLQASAGGLGAMGGWAQQQMQMQMMQQQQQLRGGSNANGAQGHHQRQQQGQHMPYAPFPPQGERR
jgi:hypothetical protein